MDSRTESYHIEYGTAAVGQILPESRQTWRNASSYELDRVVEMVARHLRFGKEIIACLVKKRTFQVVQYPYLAHLYPLRTMTLVCLRIVCGESSTGADDISSSSVIGQQTHGQTIIAAATPPPAFARAVLQLAGFLLQVIRMKVTLCKSAF